MVPWCGCRCGRAAVGGGPVPGGLASWWAGAHRLALSGQWLSAHSGTSLSAQRFLGISVRYDVETEAETEHRTSRNWKPKPNRKTELPTFRFGFGVR